jgi:hypothetical protein
MKEEEEEEDRCFPRQQDGSVAEHKIFQQHEIHNCRCFGTGGRKRERAILEPF